MAVSCEEGGKYLRGVFDADVANGSGEVFICERCVYRFVDGGSGRARERAALWALRLARQWGCWRRIGIGIGSVLEIDAMHFLLNLWGLVVDIEISIVKHTEMTCLPDMIFLAFSSSGFKAATSSS